MTDTIIKISDDVANVRKLIITVHFQSTLTEPTVSEKVAVAFVKSLKENFPDSEYLFTTNEIADD
ncbi:MAG: hypothetical protein ABL903_08500 [Methylococcales bacterium]